MTRRAEAEAMLARYGAETFCGGGSFRAVVCPAGSRGEGTAAGPRYDYFGPAAHKPPVGGTVVSGGESYTVCRCETVRLGGEELYVRAVLAPAAPPPDGGAALERNGRTFARAYSCSAEAAQGAEAVVPFGEGAPAQVAEGAVAWKLTLTGVRAESDADLFATDEFRVTAAGPGGKTAYTGCRWTGVESAEGGAYTVRALAAGREAVPGG